MTDAEGYVSNSYQTSNLYMNISNFGYGDWYKDGDWKYYGNMRGGNYDGTYKVSVYAKDTTGYYLVASNVTDTSKYEYDTSVEIKIYDTVNKSYKYTYNLYKYPVGLAGVASIQVKTTSSTTSYTTITKLPAIQVKETAEDGITFRVPSSVVLNSSEYICWEYSNNPQFSNVGENNFANEYCGWNSKYDEDDTYKVYYASFMPGDKMYVRARVFNYYYGWDSTNYVSDEEKHSAYTAALSYTVPKAKVSSVSTSVENTSITLSAYTTNGAVTGYQFAKKVGKKWVALDTQTDPTFTDAGLAKNTTYEYRVRSYTYNERTKKTVWTAWYNVKATTWGGNLNLKVAAASATSAKLTWKPVTGADGYEIYRVDTSSSGKTREKGVYAESFSTQNLIKTFTKAKAKTYTDKKLAKGKSYTYYVRAYKKIGKQKCYISASGSVNMQASDMSGVTSYITSAGKTVVTWPKKTGLKGYYVEKLDPVTDEYVTIKALKASATSYTADKVAVGSDFVQYRIRPYGANGVYNGYSFTVYPTLASVTGVKAVATAKGVQVTWKPVAGADYYRVYRTTDSDYTYDKTRKTYNYYGGQTVYEGAVNTTGCNPAIEGENTYRSDGTYYTSQIKGTSVLDTALVYKTRSTDEKGDYIVIGKTADGREMYQTEDAFYGNIEGPEPGVKYYYYVVAYADATNGRIEGYSTISSAGDSKAVEATYTNAIAKKVSKITSISSKKKGQVTVKFKKVKGVTGYAVYRSTKKNGTYTMVGTTKKTTFTDGSAEPGKTYYYKVASYVKGEAQANIYSAKTAAKKVKAKK